MTFSDYHTVTSKSRKEYFKNFIFAIVETRRQVSLYSKESLETKLLVPLPRL